MASNTDRLLVRCDKKSIFYSFFAFVAVGLIALCSFVFPENVSGAAKESSIVISQSTDSLAISLMPSPSGSFDKSGDQTINVGTDNFTGYTLVITTEDSTSMISENEDEIPTINTAIDESTFSSNSLYNNKWGYKPSQYVTVSNNLNSTVLNTNYLPAPSTQGDFLAVTTSANTKTGEIIDTDSYTLSFAAKVDNNTPVGTYEYTYILQAVANDIIYNITYNDSAGGAASGMPSPNPQAITISGGTPTAQSYGTLSNAVPTLTDMNFGGWCDEATTLNPSTESYECSGTTYYAGGQYPIDQTADGTNIVLYAIWVKPPTSTYTITFNPHNETQPFDEVIGAGSALGNDYPSPDPLYTNHIFQGWYTADTGGDLVTRDTVPPSDITYHAQWKKTVVLAQLESDSFKIPIGTTETIVVTNANELEPYTFTSNNTSVATVDANTGAITAVAKGSTTITMTGTISGATKTITVEVADLLCKLAQTGTLHTATIAQSGASVTYGQIASSITPQGGDAYDCDINNDSTYSPTNERFYFLKTSDGNMTFEAFNSYKGTGWVDGSSSDLIYSHTVAPTMLPATTDWTHPGLNEQTVLETTGRAARFMTHDEVASACVGAPNVEASGALLACPYIMEHSTFDGGGRSAMWLMDDENGHWRVHGGNTNRNVVKINNTQINTSNNMARPAIVVPSKWVEKFRVNYTISFNSHGGSPVSDVTVLSGDPLGNNYPDPDPTYTDHLFQGWYTAETGGDLVTRNTIPAGSTTYHAQWKGTVALAQIENTNINVAEGHTSTINVLNSSDIESYKFTSNNTAIATVDEDTGEITGLAEGSTTITMTGDVSHATRTINVTVVPATTTYTITFNPHNGSPSFDVTIDAGDAIDDNYPDPDPTYTNRVFQGWYTAETGGDLITSNTVPTGSTTYHGQWKLNVQQAIIANDDLTVPAGGQITIIVSNAADLEPYTFSSNDPNIATVNNAGVITGVSQGTTNIIMTGSQSHLTKTLEVDVTAAPAVMHTVSFEANGGEEVNDMSVEDGTAIGTLPTTTRTNYRFFGWYTDDGTFYNEVTPATVINSDVTYYAMWVEDTASFPIAWAETNACTFNGDAVISGDYCTQDKTMKYINTGVALFSDTGNNYSKDFEIGFTIVEYDVSAQSETQATFMNSKRENSATNYPGFVMRRSGNNIQFTGRFSNGNPTDATLSSTTTKRVRIVRQNNVLKYSINGGSYTTWFDTTNNTRHFDTPVWFGAAVQSDDTGSQRYLKGTLTDMYVKLGVNSDYVISFNANGGTANPASKTITINDPVGQLPTVTPPSENYTFDGWWDESVSPAVQITEQTIPSGDKTYKAHWHYQSSDTPVLFDVSNDATRSYQTIINNWVQSPVNITTFNKASPTINNSTWGDTSELSEVAYWTDIKQNFETYHCMIPSYSDAAKPISTLPNWTSGTVDCAKPDVYDTRIGAALNVYLDNDQGEQVTYAKADNGVIHNMIPGQTYYWEKQDDSSVYGYVTATSPNGRRWIDAGQIRNVRDLGGLPASYTDSNNNTVTGTLAYGRLFRGEQLWSAPLTELTNLGINKEYDVGNPSEYTGNSRFPDPNYVHDEIIHYNFETYDASSTSNYMKAWTAVTDIMTDIVDTNSPKNIYFHCRVGADRTGTTAYLLEGLLGVPDEARYEEYSLTHLSGLYDRTRYYKQKSSTNNLKFVFMMGYLQTNADIYNWYMQNPNADANLIQAFRSAMVEPD